MILPKIPKIPQTQLYLTPLLHSPYLLIVKKKFNIIWGRYTQISGISGKFGKWIVRHISHTSFRIKNRYDSYDRFLVFLKRRFL